MNAKTWAMLCVLAAIVALAAGCGGATEQVDANADTAAVSPAQHEAAKAAGVPVAITNSIGMKLVLIPAGEFMMGSAESAEELARAFREYGAPPADLFFEDEHPQHRVRITQPFYLGVHEVTVGQFRKFVEDTGYKTDAEKGTLFPGAVGFDPKTGAFGLSEEYSWRNAGFEQTDEHPVVNVSWNDAVAFCEWLSRKEGKTYRLPTEAEWEYACRAGTTTRYYHGDDPEGLAAVTNVGDATFRAKFPQFDWTIKAEDGYVFTAPVGKFKPNAFGLYDVHGNVWEWCADWYGADYYANSPVEDPAGPASGLGSYRVIRGGSWFGRARRCRSAYRDGGRPDDRGLILGFRVALARRKAEHVRRTGQSPVPGPKGTARNRVPPGGAGRPKTAERPAGRFLAPGFSSIPARRSPSPRS